MTEQKNNEQTIEGELERIVYQSDEDSYTIARFKPNDQNIEITITGNLAGAQPGEILNIKGRWSNHKKFGPQFSVQSFTCLIPTTVRGIEKYLSCGLIKGIGPVMAKRLVSVFGADTLDIIEKTPERLGCVEGIGTKRIEMITKAWDTQKEVKQIMLFLQSHNVSAALAVKIYKRYGQKAISIVKENPYRLSTDIFGIGFKSADKIATQLGVPTDSLMRAKAGVLFTLNQMAEKGHCFLPVPLLVEECSNILNIKQGLINDAIGELKDEGRIIIEGDLYFDASNQRIECAYLSSYFFAEAGICSIIKRLLNVRRHIRQIDLNRALDWVQSQMGIILDPIQKEAVIQSIENKIMVITGGPGTGKTTIIRAVLAIFSALGLKIFLAAPTGRATKRMQEATHYDARTIHRLLEYSPKERRFSKNEQNPIDADLVIIDEVSMVDTMLMYNLLKAVKPDVSLIFVGDADQLPSVGAGNVLEDICGSGIIKVVKLMKVFRQAQKSLIVSNAHRILAGEFPVIPKKGDKADFFFVVEEEPERVLNMIVELYKVHIPNRFGFDPYKDIQVLTPMNKGMTGASNLNLVLQNHLNPVSPAIHKGIRLFKLHDKVMQIRNNYDKEVFNGDIGKIVHLDEDMLEIVVEFDNRNLTYDLSDLDELFLAYAISVHKSQGSEYPVIIMPVTLQHYHLLQRNLIYTALTRAKRLMIMVGTKKALAIAIRNTKIENRFTLLSERLRRMGKNSSDPSL